MSFFKTVMDSFNSIASFSTYATPAEKQKSQRNDEDFSGITDDAGHIHSLTKQFIDNDLAIDKNKKHWETFSEHRETLIQCLKRYEDASLSQLETSQKMQAKAMLENLQLGKELAADTGNVVLIDREDYVNALKKITLSYCEKHALRMGDFITNIPEHLCDGKYASTAWQSIRKDASKKRWKNFDQACNDNSLICFSSEVLFDTTLWGSAKHGFMLGRDDIICLGGEPEKFRVLWSNVTSLWYHKGYLYVNDYKTGFVANDEACAILELLEEHYNKIKRSAGNMLLAYLGYDQTQQQAIKKAYKADVQQFIE